MKTIRFIIRLLISLILLLPSIPFFYITASFFGLFFVLSVYGLLLMPIGWLTNDKKALEDGLELLDMTKELLEYPFVFWYQFTMNLPIKSL